ncbi:MAG: hypothetical protein ABR899_11495 [Candidatus Krumholzibacteriaceae bacterium]
MNLHTRKTVRRNAALRRCAIVIGLSIVWFGASGARGEAMKPGPLFIGMQGGYLPENSTVFSEGECTRKELFGDWFLGVRVRPYLAVRASLVYHDGFDAVCPESPPLPPHGPYDWSRPEFGAGGDAYPYYSSEFDLVAEPLPARWPVSPRLLAGWGWIWKQDIPMWLAGVGLAAGSERVRLVLDVKKCWFEVPYEMVTYHYEDGVLAGRHAVSRRSREHPLAVMAGVEFGVPWFK